MAKYDARYAAYNILRDVTDKKAYYNLTLKEYLKDSMSAEDKRFASSLAALTLEHFITLDYYLKPFISVKRVHAGIMHILRLGACQIKYMRVPESAAVNESVNLAKAIGKQALAGFVNAVLRNFAKNYQTVALPADEAGRIAVEHGFPLWMAGKFIKQWGLEEAKAFFSYRTDNQYTCIRINALKTNRTEFEKKIQFHNLEFKKSFILDDAYYIKNITDIERLDIFHEGLAAVMGESSMIAVRAAVSLVEDGAKLLDACSAPGGKSAYAAAIKQNNLQITAWELHEHRAKLIKKNFERLGVSNARIEARDASVFAEEYTEVFDLVMIDAPCSALGLVHKKPDIRLHRKPEDITELAEMQQSILQTCGRYVKKGGFLAYFTCTLTKEENENAVNRFLQKNTAFQHIEKFMVPGSLKERVQKGMLTIKPHEDGLDGFFIALMEKNI